MTQIRERVHGGFIVYSEFQVACQANAWIHRSRVVGDNNRQFL